jgi:predicted KAP-like P-loop ATPase
MNMKEILTSAEWSFKAYGNQNGFKDQNKYATGEIDNIKKYISEELEKLISSKSSDYNKGVQDCINFIKR